MDIDEFLDKEIQAKEKEEPNKEAVFIKDTQNTGEDEKLTPKYAEDGLNSLEKQYFELWDRISKNNLLWDDSLYKSITASGSAIKEITEKLLLKTQNERKAIKEIIGKANKELENKNLEAALNLYSKLIDIRNGIPDAFFEEKKDINYEIFLLYQKLHEQIDLKFINDLKENLAKVESFTDNSLSSIKSGKLEQAKNFYQQALEMYKSLPKGFLLRKAELGNKLLVLYKELSIHIQIQELQQQLGNLGRSYLYHLKDDHNLQKLAEIVKHYKEQKTDLKMPRNLALKSARGEEKHHRRKNLLKKLIERKLERANISLQKGFYVDARKNLQSVLRLDPQNKEAKAMLGKMPA